ncbi:hypothetical protein [Prescottella subtropica]|uniref:hypothetical protein n=1 Tax=Prescottella subtropica TaxID=2545757 RepID=UPI0010F7F496|nr:hypothetical protein [Prescottella subtropica]
MGTYRVTELDRLRAADRSVTVAGPVDIGSVDDLRAALVQFAGVGPQTRAGLVASGTSTEWVYDPDAVAGAVDELPATPPDEIGGLAARLRTRDLGAASIRMTLSGTYVALDCSHGIADGRVQAAMLGIVTRAAQVGEVPDAWSRPEDRFLVARAVARTFGSDPRRVASLCRDRRTARHRAAGVDGAVDLEAPPWQPSSASRYSRQGPDVIRALRRWRDTSAQGASMRAVTLTAFAEAVRQVGIPTAPRVHILVDARRFLSRDVVCNGNFAVGLDIPETCSPVEATVEIVRAMRTGRPLATLGAVSVKSMLARRRPPVRPPSGPDLRGCPTPARIAYSDIGRVPETGGVSWSAVATERHCAVFTDPSGPDGITFVGVEIDGTRHLSVSFHDNVFDADSVQRALDLVAVDPVALLESAMPVR